MATYSVSNDRILIVCGYTDQEVLRRSNGEEIPDPPSFYFEVKNVQYTSHIKSYEGFESAQGLIPIEKACDNFAELSFDVLVHQNITDAKGSFVIDNTTKEVRLRITDKTCHTEETVDGNLVLPRYVTPEEYTDEFIELRKNFFADLDGRPLIVVSSMFPSLPTAFIENVDFNIPEGEEDPTYSVTIKEYIDTGL